MYSCNYLILQRYEKVICTLQYSSLQIFPKSSKPFEISTILTHIAELISEVLLYEI